jgi:hypothetical protein
VASTKLKSIARRIAKLEGAFSPRRKPEDWCGWQRSSSAPSPLPPQLRLGNLRRLPGDYQGERHIAIAQYFPDQYGHKCVEFTEVPGPPPSPPAEAPGFTYVDLVLVDPLPSSSFDD